MITSVVVASNRDVSLLDACLTSLRDSCARRGAELIVSRPADLGPPASDLRRRYSYATIVSAPAGSGIPELRGIGLERAGDGATALTEDHCVAADGWLDALSAALDGADVAGGGMGNAQDRRAVDWGAYYSEYGFFSWTRPPGPANAPPLLTGANVAYAESVRGRVAAWARAGVWENVAHGRLHAEGRVLCFAPGARILQNKRYTFRSFCRDRYEHGLDYARTRLAEEATSSRWMLAAASPALTIVLTARIARAAARLDPAAFVRALPCTAAFLASWSAGEAMGYLRGPAQTSS